MLACSTIPKPTAGAGDKGISPHSSPGRAPHALPALQPSARPTDTSQARNGIKRGHLNGTVDYRLGLGRVILSFLPFPAASPRLRFPAPTAQRCFARAPVLGTVEHLVLLVCN